MQKTHEEGLFDASNDREIWLHFTDNGYGRENFSKNISHALQKRNGAEEYPFIIKDLRTHTYAGRTRIYDVSNENKTVKLGHTWIGRKYQGTSLNRNCKFLLFEFLFDQMEMERIGLGASSENIHSIKAMESVDCLQEGRLRSFFTEKEFSIKN